MTIVRGGGDHLFALKVEARRAIAGPFARRYGPVQTQRLVHDGEGLLEPGKARRVVSVPRIIGAQDSSCLHCGPGLQIWAGAKELDGEMRVCAARTNSR